MKDTYYLDATGRRLIDKGPAERLWYSVDISDWLDEGDSIDVANAQVTISDELVVHGSAQYNPAVGGKVLLSGGTLGQRHPITWTLPTLAGNVFVRTVWLNIVPR